MGLGKLVQRIFGRVPLKPGEQSVRFGRCPICRAKWVAQDTRGNIRCANDHRFGPDAPRDELFNTGDHRGEL